MKICLVLLIYGFGLGISHSSYAADLPILEGAVAEKLYSALQSASLFPVTSTSSGFRIEAARLICIHGLSPAIVHEDGSAVELGDPLRFRCVTVPENDEEAKHFGMNEAKGMFEAFRMTGLVTLTTSGASEGYQVFSLSCDQTSSIAAKSFHCAIDVKGPSGE